MIAYCPLEELEPPVRHNRKLSKNQRRSPLQLVTKKLK